MQLKKSKRILLKAQLRVIMQHLMYNREPQPDETEQLRRQSLLITLHSLKVYFGGTWTDYLCRWPGALTASVKNIPTRVKEEGQNSSIALLQNAAQLIGSVCLAATASAAPVEDLPVGARPSRLTPGPFNYASGDATNIPLAVVADQAPWQLHVEAERWTTGMRHPVQTYSRLQLRVPKVQDGRTIPYGPPSVILEAKTLLGDAPQGLGTILSVTELAIGYATIDRPDDYQLGLHARGAIIDRIRLHESSIEIPGVSAGKELPATQWGLAAELAWLSRRTGTGA